MRCRDLCERDSAKAESFLKREPGGLLEQGNEAYQIAVFMRAFQEQVDVVRHNTVGVNVEVFMRGGGFQPFDKPTAELEIREEGSPFFSADCHEVTTLSEVIASVETDTLSVN